MSIISVVVPVYKVEDYLQRCIDSLLEQSFKDFDLILVDDGSPDSCPEICDQNALIDKRITVIHQDNSGLSAARNAGIQWSLQNSESNWICFVDSDDWVHPDYLAYLYRAVMENNVLISVCDFVKTQEYFKPADKLEYISKIQLGTDLYVENNLCATVAWNKLCKKSLFINSLYPVNKKHEDEFLTYKFLYESESIAYVNLSLYYYFFGRPGSIMNGDPMDRLEILTARKEQCIFFYENSCEKALHFAYYMYRMYIARYSRVFILNGRWKDYRYYKNESRMLTKYIGGSIKLSRREKYNIMYFSFPHIMPVFLKLDSMLNKK